MKNSSVNAVIFSKDQKEILIIKRRDVPIWVIPGGIIEKGESPEEAVVREVAEETGCVVAISRKSGVYQPVNRLTVTTHVFVCEVLSGTPKTGNETRDIGFFSLDSLPKSFFHVHKELVDDALENTNVVIEKSLTQVTYFNLFKYFLQHPLRVICFILSQLGLPINS